MGGKGAKEVESTANVGRQGENQHTNRDHRKRRSKTYRSTGRARRRARSDSVKEAQTQES